MVDDTRTTRLRVPRPPSPRAILAGYGLHVAPPTAVERRVLAAYELLPAYLAEPEPEPDRQRTWPEDVPTAAELIDPEEPVPSRTRPGGMVDWRPAGLRWRLSRFADRLGLTVELYRERVRRYLAEGGDGCRRGSWEGM